MSWTLISIRGGKIHFSSTEEEISIQQPSDHETTCHHSWMMQTSVIVELQQGGAVTFFRTMFKQTRRHRWQTHGGRWRTASASPCTEERSLGRRAAGRSWRTWARWRPAWSGTWWGRRSTTAGTWTREETDSVNQKSALLWKIYTLIL